MAMFPEAQAKAQAEIDAVIGKDRLPDFGDYEFLPYVVATVKECMRWQLVLPLGWSCISCSSSLNCLSFKQPLPTLALRTMNTKGFLFPPGPLLWAVAGASC